MACHTFCKDYKNWKAEHDNRKAEIVERDKTANQILAAKIDFSNEYNRRSKWRKK